MKFGEFLWEILVKILIKVLKFQEIEEIPGNVKHGVYRVGKFRKSREFEK